MPRVEVRLATPEDAPAIARVHVASWQAAYRGIVPDRILDTATRVLDFDGTPIEEMRYRAPARTAEPPDRTIG